MSWKSEDEINKAYIDHIITLHEAGIDHDPEDISTAWERELEEFRNPTNDYRRKPKHAKKGWDE